MPANKFSFAYSPPSVQDLCLQYIFCLFHFRNSSFLASFQVKFAFILLNNHFVGVIHLQSGCIYNFVSIARTPFVYFCYYIRSTTMSLISSFFDEFVPFLLRNSQFDMVELQNAAKQHTDKLKQNGDIGFPTSLKAWFHAVDVPFSQKIIDETDAARQTALIESSRKWSFPIQRIQCSDNRCVLFLDRAKCFENVLKNVLNEKQEFGRWKQPTGNKEIFNVGLLLHSNNDSLTEHRCTLIRNVLVNLLKVSGYQVSANDVNQTTVKLIVTHPRSDIEKRQGENGMETPIQATKIVCGHVKGHEYLTATNYIQLVDAIGHTTVQTDAKLPITWFPFLFVWFQVPCTRHGKNGRHEIWYRKTAYDFIRLRETRCGHRCVRSIAHKAHKCHSAGSVDRSIDHIQRCRIHFV